MTYIAKYAAPVNSPVASKQFLDRQILHKNLCRACGNMKRADSQTLFKADLEKDMILLTVQSMEEPGEIPGFSRIICLEKGEEPAEGSEISFTVLTNPSYSINGDLHYLKAEEHRLRWVRERLEKGGLTDISIREGNKENIVFRHTDPTQGLGQIDARNYQVNARVSDSNAFKELKEHGIGRGLPYGLGLICSEKRI